MSVLVKGMKMPKKCGQCELFHAKFPIHCKAVEGHRTVGAPYGMPRPDWCPLVEVKEPHDRLIDAGKLLEDHGIKLTEEFAPTVIEAEGMVNKVST